MLAIVSWVCACGTHVKAMYETDAPATLRCPNPFCDNKHIVDGKVTELWVESAGDKWVRHDVSPLTVQ